MGNIAIFALLCGALALLLALAYVAFELALYTLYKLDGGRLDLISYIKKL